MSVGAKFLASLSSILLSRTMKALRRKHWHKWCALLVYYRYIIVDLEVRGQPRIDADYGSGM